MPSNKQQLLSLIVPARNEQENIPSLRREIESAVRDLTDLDVEVLLIDNASDDRTGELARAICAECPNWKYVRFSRNFGSEASIAAGLELCRGDAAIILFSDLQDPPAFIPRLVEKWRQGNDIVYGIYSGNKHQTLWKRVLITSYYHVLRRLADVPMVPFAGDFRLYDRRVIDVLNRFPERNRYLRGLAQWIGYKSDSIHYERQPRRAGKSKAPFFYLFSFAFSVIVNFSDKPLRFFSVFGLGVSVLAFLMTIGLIVNYWIAEVVPGLTTTHALLTLNLGFTALGFGTLGEYVSKIYTESKGRPLYLIDTTVGIGGVERRPQTTRDHLAPQTRANELTV